MTKTVSRSVLGWWCAVTVFVSAFLLFQIQPVISKIILPWFGGSPSVWTTCMLFFQAVLLAGYLYAHLLMRLPPKGQAVVHILVLLVAICVLPIMPGPSWRATDVGHPASRILLLLAVNVGLPYFLLSSMAPLVQVWFSRAVGASPYRLYALSNVGSLGALLTYPFIVEPELDSPMQSSIWGIAFAVFAASTAWLAVRIWQTPPLIAKLEPGAAPKPVADTGVNWKRRMVWLLLPAFGSVMLLAVTNHICQDVAVIPFLWIAPLSLYLLSFIICFDRESWYWPSVYGALAVALIGTVGLLMLDDVSRAKYLPFAPGNWISGLPDFLDNLTLEIGLYLGVLFLVCMICHGEVVRLKPDPSHLTEFYLCIAAGGVLGGLIVAVVCPNVFHGFWEMNISLVLGYLLAAWVTLRFLWRLPSAVKWWLLAPAAAIGTLGLTISFGALMDEFNTDLLAAKRSFYGVLTVADRGTGPEAHRHTLYHGRILHGVQLLDPKYRRTPVSYYCRGSGIGVTLDYFTTQGPKRVATVGLGTGTTAVYGEPGDYYRFYEINPQVRELNQKYFTYISDTPAKVDIVMGDARLSMEKEQPQQMDVIALDAFSGDAIPAHLLTREAFAVYRRHLKPTGVLCVHISNRYLDLEPIVTLIAESYGMQAVVVDCDDDETDVTSAGSVWVLVTNNEDFLNDPEVQPYWRDTEPVDPRIRMWTDQYSNLYDILK